jgi:phosphate transport system substrate-binding protein
MRGYSRKAVILAGISFVMAALMLACITSVTPTPFSPTQTAFLLSPSPFPTSTATPEKPEPSPTSGLQTEPVSNAGFTLHGGTTGVCDIGLFWYLFSAEDKIQIDIECADSGSSIESVATGKMDAGIVHRKLTESELSSYPDLQIHAICWVEVAVVVHPDVPVNELTVDQVRNIYSGRTTDWREVAGESAQIVVITYIEDSSNRYIFTRTLMGGDTITDTAWTAFYGRDMRTGVSITPHSIGYLPFAFLNETVKTISINGVEPTIEKVTSGEYPLSIPLYLVTNGEPSEAVSTWLDFIYSGEGQATIIEEGGIPAR